jgi:nucleoside-diphosphate-sugar epimerase
MQHHAATNEDFNLSTAESTTVLDLAKLIWKKINGEKPFEATFDNPYEHDVQKRIPSVEKAKNMLGFEATTTLDEMLDKVIPWIHEAIRQDLI